MCYFYNVKQQQLKQNKFTQLIVTLHIQTHYMAHNNQTTMLIKSKEHLEGALFGAFASLVEIEQIYTIHEERDLDFTVQEPGAACFDFRLEFHIVKLQFFYQFHDFTGFR